jgi:energy-coupling factor transporter ATP-binding protein EcfA2
MIIRNVNIEAYRSLLDIQWSGLGDRVVVVGDNASGKSNLFRFLDLVLNRGPRSSMKNLLDVTLSGEPAPVYFGSLSSATGDRRGMFRGVVELEFGRKELFARWHERVFGPWEHSDTDEHQRQLLAVMEHLLQNPGEGVAPEACRVHLHVTGRPSSDDDPNGGLQIQYEKVVLDGVVLFKDGDSLVDLDANDGRRWGDARGLDVDFLREVTRGFQYLDCPRFNQGVEKVIPHPTLDADAIASGATGYPFWSDLFKWHLANTLHHADRDPRGVLGVDRLRGVLRREHGLLTIHRWLDDSQVRVSGSENSPSSSGSPRNEPRDYLRLELRDLPEFRDSTGWLPPLPVEHRGTGFEQLLHILSRVELTGARVLAIDELESSLSPNSQRELWRVLGRLIHSGAIDQVLVTSHSPVFLDGDGPPHGELPDVWFARYVDSTSVERLGGPGSDVSAALRDHFSASTEHLWRRTSTAEWSVGGETSFEFFMYLPDGSEQPIGRELDVVAETLDQLALEPSLFALRVEASVSEASRGVPLLGVLGLRLADEPGRTVEGLRIEWQESTDGFGILRGPLTLMFQVVGLPAPTGAAERLTLQVQVSVPPATIGEQEPVSWVPSVRDELEARLREVLRRLSH